MQHTTMTFFAKLINLTNYYQIYGFCLEYLSSPLLDVLKPGSMEKESLAEF